MDQQEAWIKEPEGFVQTIPVQLWIELWQPREQVGHSNLLRQVEGAETYRNWRLAIRPTEQVWQS